jgi:hypothetical protein
MSQFYKMTLTDAIEQHKAGCITAIGLVNIYFQIELKQGWKKRYNPKDIYTKLDISKATFYRALAKLQVENYISFEIHGEITVTNTNLRNKTEVLNLRQESQVCDESLKSKTEVLNLRQESQVCDNQRLEPAPSTASRPPSDLYSDSYQTYLISLSEGERKNFLNFCQEEAKKLPKPPTLPMRWIERNLEDLKAKWESFNKVSDESNKFSVWANHPRFDELWQGVCEQGTTSYVIQNIRDTTIKDFCKFCHESKEIMEEILSCLNSH